MTVGCHRKNQYSIDVQGIITKIINCERESRIYDIKSDPDLYRFIQSPILEIILKKISLEKEKSAANPVNVNPILTLVAEKMDSWFINSKVHQTSTPEESPHASSQIKRREAQTMEDKEDFVKKLLEYLDNKMPEINTTILSGENPFQNMLSINSKQTRDICLATDAVSPKTPPDFKEIGIQKNCNDGKVDSVNELIEENKEEGNKNLKNNHEIEFYQSFENSSRNISKKYGNIILNKDSFSKFSRKNFDTL